MDEKKVNLTGGISAGIMKGWVDSYISILTNIFNTSLERGCSPNQLKLAEKTPEEINKENYRLVVFFPIHLRYLKE